MQRKLPLAIALFAATGAYAADNNVILYGIVNAPLSYADNGSVKQLTLASPNTPSRFGLKGEEDLGDGMKAFFQIEQAVRIDDASVGSFASREGWVGLTGAFGKIGLGRGKTPYHNLSDTWDAIVDGDRNFTVFNDGLLGLLATSRPNNAVRYDSPNFSGFSGSIHYAAGENKTTAVDASSTISLAGRYASGPLFAGLAWEQSDKIANATGAPLDGAKNTALLVGGTYKIEAFKLGLAYQNAKQQRPGTGDTKRDAWLFTGTYDIGATTLKAGAILNQKVDISGKGRLDGSDYTRYSLGAKYAFSKRTATYVEYSADDYKKDLTGKNKPDVSSLSLGLIHVF